MAAMNPGNMHNITTLIRRLEAATLRLEDMAQMGGDITPRGHQPGTPMHPNESGAIPINAPGTVRSQLNGPPNPSPTTTAPQPPAMAPERTLPPLDPKIEDFDTLIAESVEPYVQLSSDISPLVSQQSKAVERTFQEQRIFLLVTTKAKKPDMTSSTFLECLTGMQREMGRVMELAETNRSSPQYSHLSAVSEGMQALSWVTLDRAPAKHVESTLGSIAYHGNKILKEYRGKDQKQIDWLNAYNKIYKMLISYIKEHYLASISWTPNGIDAKEALKQVHSNAPASTATGTSSSGTSTPAPATAPGPPPPPPPPPPANLYDDLQAPSQAPKAAGQTDMNSVFSQLNQGSAVTSSLRRVDKSQMTHKNPALRASSAVPERSDSLSSQSSSQRSRSPLPPAKPSNMRSPNTGATNGVFAPSTSASTSKSAPTGRSTQSSTPSPTGPRKIALEGNRWILENLHSEPQPVTLPASEVQMNQFIQISRCSNTTIRVEGKANAVTIDSSEKVSLIVDSLVSSIDVIRSPKFALQVLGSLPTLLLNGVDGAQVYLGSGSGGTEVLTAQCSGVNLNIVVGEGEEEDYVECPLPEQMRSVVKGGKVVTEIVEHAG